MKFNNRWLVGGATAAVMVSALAIAGAPGRADTQGPVAGIGSTHTITVKATVKAIDLATRHLTLVGPSGETFTVKVGEHVQRLGEVKVGDTITGTYSREALFVLSARGAALPPDTESIVAARAAKGELPAAVVANHVIVTGAVLAVDLTDHTLQIVDPKGGQVHTVSVEDPQAQQEMSHIKVGDTITAYVTESVLISLD